MHGLGNKRLVSILLVIFIFGSLLAGCGGSTETKTGDNTSVAEEKDVTEKKDDTAAPKTEVTEISVSTWGAPDEKAVFDKLVADFEAANKDIKVKVLHIPDDYVGKMNTMLAGGTAPDVIFVPDGDFGRWVTAGLLVNIQKYVDTSDLAVNDMWESALVRYKYDGKYLGRGDLYALPKDIGPTVIYYNKELFDAAGVPHPSAEKPMTFDEFLETSKKLTKDTNGDGKIDQYGMGPIWWEGFVWSNGGEIFNKDMTEFLLDEPAATEGLQFAADLGLVHNVVPDSRALQSMNDDQMFQTGRLAMKIQGRWMVPTYRKLDFDWDIAPMPAGKTGISTGWSGSVGFAINKQAKNPDQAYKLIEYFAGPVGQEKMAELGFSIPNFKSMASQEKFLQPDQKPANAQVFLMAAENQRPGPWTFVPNNKWFDVLNQNLGKMWSGEKTAAELMKELEPKIMEALKEGNPQYFEN
jgi:multiple sugar transport system substrate-binding protein